MADRVYTKDEAEAILARAIELHGHGEATSHTELVATAREIGVAPEALEKAASEVLARRRDDQAVRTLRARQWRGFLAHLVPFVCVGVLLGFINVVTGGFPWAVIPMLAWGIGLASHLLAVVLPDEERLRRRVARRRELERGSRRGASLGVDARAHGQEPSGGRLRIEAGDGSASVDAVHADPSEGEAEIEQALDKGSRSG
jgi:2TM domain